MDALSTLYDRLRAQHPMSFEMPEAPRLEDWLRFWNDAGAEVGDFRNSAYWLSRRRIPRKRAEHR